MSEEIAIKLDAEFFGSNEYDTTKAANKLLEEFWDPKVDLSALREYLGKKIDELNEFVINSVDYLKVQSTTFGFLEELKWVIKDAEAKTKIISEKCSNLYGEQHIGRDESRCAFSELNELLFERNKVLTEKARLENEQRWSCLKAQVKDELAKGDFSKVSELIRTARDSLSRVATDENAEGKRQIIDEVEAYLLEVLQYKQIMDRYALDLKKLRELRDMSIIIGKGMMFFALYVSPLRMKIENIWKEGHVHMEETNGKSYLDYLNEFFEESLNSISEELKRIESVALNHEVIAAMSIIDIFCGLTPSFIRRFSTYVYSNENLSIGNVAKLYNTCESFSLRLERLILKFLHDNDSEVGKLISSRTFCNYSESMFGYFPEYQEEFIESELLALNRSTCEIINKAVEMGRKSEVRHLIDYCPLVEELFNQINDSISGSITISQGISLCLLLPQLDSIMDEAFINMFYAICNFDQLDTSEQPLIKVLSHGNSELESRLKMSMYKERNNVQNRAQFLALVSGLSFCTKFCSCLNDVSNKLSNTNVLNPKCPHPNFTEARKNSNISITSSYVIYKQTALLEKNLELRKIIAANVHVWIENLNSFNTYSKVTLALFEMCSKTLTSIAKFCQKSLLENIIRPIEDQFSGIGSTSNDNIANSYLQYDENTETFTSHAATQIGEYLLTLPLILDPYLEGNALSFSLETLPSNEGSFKDFELPAKPPAKSTENYSGYEDYTLARWIRAILLLAIEKFEHLAARNITVSTSIPGKSSQLKVDLEYLDKIMNSLDIGMVRPFMECAERLIQTSNCGYLLKT